MSSQVVFHRFLILSVLLLESGEQAVTISLAQDTNVAARRLKDCPSPTSASRNPGIVALRLGMTNKGKKPQHQGPITTLNSSSQQCKHEPQLFQFWCFFAHVLWPKAKQAPCWYEALAGWTPGIKVAPGSLLEISEETIDMGRFPFEQCEGLRLRLGVSCLYSKHQ